MKFSSVACVAILAFGVSAAPAFFMRENENDTLQSPESSSTDSKVIDSVPRAPPAKDKHDPPNWRGSSVQSKRTPVHDKHDPPEYRDLNFFLTKRSPVHDKHDPPEYRDLSSAVERSPSRDQHDPPQHRDLTSILFERSPVHDKHNPPEYRDLSSVIGATSAAGSS